MLINCFVIKGIKVYIGKRRAAAFKQKIWMINSFYLFTDFNEKPFFGPAGLVLNRDVSD